MPRRKKIPSSVSAPRSQLPENLDLQRIRDDITALKTAIHLQATLLSDLEKALDLTVEIPALLKAEGLV